MGSEPTPAVREVRSYVLRLLIVILVGAAMMVGAAVYAWQRYGKDLQDTERRAPLPSRIPEPIRPPPR